MLGISSVYTSNARCKGFIVFLYSQLLMLEVDGFASVPVDVGG